MKEAICRQILRAPKRRLSYADYMHLALYDETHGYYMKNGDKIGRFGDFFTSSHVSDAFGALFASFFIRLVKTGQIAPRICELGGGDGVFARAVLQEWSKASPDTYEPLQYIIVETSPYQREKQREALAPFHAKVLQYASLAELKQEQHAFAGIVFSNEFFDALPVHVIVKEGGIMQEVFVAVRDGELIEEKRPLENEAIIAYLRERNLSLREGQRMEIPLALKSFLADSASVFQQGVMVTIDYGYTDEEWRLPARRQGSLRGYYQHRLVADPLAYPGEMDLTAHVHWDALRLYGGQAGWEWVALIRQDRFLLANGMLRYLAAHHDPNPFSAQSRRNRAIRSLVTDEGMSAFFQIALQQKNVRIHWETIWTDPHFWQ